MPEHEHRAGWGDATQAWRRRETQGLEPLLGVRGGQRGRNTLATPLPILGQEAPGQPDGPRSMLAQPLTCCPGLGVCQPAGACSGACVTGTLLTWRPDWAGRQFLLRRPHVETAALQVPSTPAPGRAPGFWQPHRLSVKAVQGDWASYA